MKDAAYRPPRWARNGHANTILAHPRQPGGLRVSKRRYSTADGDFYDVHTYARVGAPDPDDAAILVILHGFEGSGEATYVQRLAAAALARGWSVRALNNRGCSGEDNRGLQAYHAGFTADLDDCLRRLRREHPAAIVALAGFSLGGSQSGNWLARHVDAPDLVDAAALISPPLDLAASCQQIDGALLRAYSLRFLRTLRPKVRLKASRFAAARTPAKQALRATGIRSFDHLWTAPIHGFGDGATYYASCSVVQRLHRIRVPTVVLHAADDPFIPPAAVPASAFVAAPHVELLRTRHGGHCGWWSADLLQAERWLISELERRCGRA